VRKLRDLLIGQRGIGVDACAVTLANLALSPAASMLVDAAVDASIYEVVKAAAGSLWRVWTLSTPPRCGQMIARKFCAMAQPINCLLQAGSHDDHRQRANHGAAIT
jgi:hypothetical protein